MKSQQCLVILVAVAVAVNGLCRRSHRSPKTKRCRRKILQNIIGNSKRSSHHRHRSLSRVRSLSDNRLDNEGIDCGALEPYFDLDDPLIQRTSGILTEKETFICVGKISSTPFLAECPILPDHDQSYEHPYRIIIDAFRESPTKPDCWILDVYIYVRPDFPSSPSSESEYCNLVLINGALKISCPPDTISDKYKRISLFPVRWDDAHLWHHEIPRGVGYIICGQRDVYECDSPAVFLSAFTSKILESRHVVILQESS